MLGFPAFKLLVRGHVKEVPGPNEPPPGPLDEPELLHKYRIENRFSLNLRAGPPDRRLIAKKF
jgi:hypothetical protein